jgi:hypothetical protein
VTLLNIDAGVSARPRPQTGGSTLTFAEAPASVPPPPPEVIAPRNDLIPAEETDWRSLRDFVVAAIERRWGARPDSDPVKEAAIFKRFLSTWGDLAMPIARLAFERYDGMWAGAPISVNRFCRGSDPFFGEVIVRDHSLRP